MFRAPILLGTIPDASMIAASAGWALGAFLLGWITFTYKANDFAYRL
jgi:ABC-type polysaccharide/polyol phosphate export permease